MKLLLRGRIRGIFRVFRALLLYARVLTGRTGGDDYSATLAVTVQILIMSPKEYVWPSHIAEYICMMITYRRVWINRVRLSIQLVVS